MDKTVSELAEELDINKLRIYRYIKKHNIKPVRTDKNVQYFDETVSESIFKHFKDVSGRHVSNDTEGDTTSDTAENALIDLKDSIISRQDKEIEQLYRQVESLQRTIDQQNKQFDQQQQLELESIRTFKKNIMIDSEYHPDTESDTRNTSSNTTSDAFDTRGYNKKNGLFSWLKRSKD